ncbi:hypothetical protein JCM15457_523 [Liquorilactobacillus sucicola DSM 21376 = JCM 15457]|uniref:DUF4649 domain-containing protein n=1 Tax=Liquorilactobacillus sucicola DSM 21376 = JCM 15457 TaxID=1423806 RepID=A0A023CUV2_9LACO|nr:hypothetical protein [Liquorilactobacillus sucicola]KRN05565.1 hypothetical protein FD15_GL002128 [Liquorilactobacillus sucicola DSM 21376 = JCM 15457]GAJ25647.1 hypothetical protein JCM15457_523 [Liquorilactobacillus sucicola DSM 21376 = JCM 15457]
MLKITYSAENNAKASIEFEGPASFVADEQLEVPKLQDYYRIDKVTVSNERLHDFNGQTIADLYNYFLEKLS